LLLVMLAEDFEPEECEADWVVEAVSEAVMETLLEPLPLVEVLAAATASNCQRKAHKCSYILKDDSLALPMSCTKVNASEPRVACQHARYEAPPFAPAVVANTAVLHASPGLASQGTPLAEAARSVFDEHAV
jgi:hypothetical protein